MRRYQMGPITPTTEAADRRLREVLLRHPRPWSSRGSVIYDANGVLVVMLDGDPETRSLLAGLLGAVLNATEVVSVKPG